VLANPVLELLVVMRFWLLVLMMGSLFVLPASATACGRSMASLGHMDITHPVDPCVNVTMLVEAAVSGIMTQINTINLPTPPQNLLLSPILIVAFLICWQSPHLLTLTPLKPPPR
jgi:hypothetical protein